MTLKGSVLMMICQVPNKDPHLAWTHLNKQYIPTDTNTFAQLTQELKQLKPKDFFEDFDPWINQLIAINSQMGTIAPSYLKSDPQMIAHILFKLSKEAY